MDNLIIIGKIVAPHGVRGDVRVSILTDFPDRFLNLHHVWLDEHTSLIIENASFHKQFVLLKFKGLDCRDSVESLRGRLLQVKPSELVKLPENHFFVFEIIGLDVYTLTGEKLGTVTDIIQTGSNDVYVIEQEGKKPLLIPAIKDVVKCINIADKKITVQLQEEWD